MMNDVPAGGAPQEELLAITGLQGNATTLVEIAAAPAAQIAEIVVVSRDRQAQAAFTPSVGGTLMIPLAEGDYLVAARPTARSNRATCRRMLVDAGRAYGYGIPMPLAALPAAPAEADVAAPALTRLAYTGSRDGAARLVVEWSAGSAAHCLCIRSPQWGGHWLPYQTPSAAAFCLPDGAYQIRAARLAADGARLGAWSEVSELVIAEGRLAAAPSSGGGDVLDWIGVKPGWRPAGNVDLNPDGVSGVAGRRYAIAWRRESGGVWQTAVAACPERLPELSPGRFRVRICAVDDIVFLRSEFFAECIATVSAASPVPQIVASDVPDASLDWVPLDNRHDAALTEFLARPITSLASGRAAVDLAALAYGPSPQPAGSAGDIAVAGALARGDLAPDQIAAAGDYFLRAGQFDAARHVFERLGRQYRGVDFAQLRCAQLAALAGRGDEARELLRLALLPAKGDPTRGWGPGPAVANAEREAVGAQPPRAGARIESAVGTAGNTARRDQGLSDELPALRFKAQQYDRLMRELPALRDKAKRYDEARGERAGRRKGVVQRLRHWSGRLPGMRPH